MKIAIVNGSPRKGNTVTAINAFVSGAGKKHEIEIIEANKLNMAPCQGCNVCECTKGCVARDDTNPTVDKLAAADMVIFATPVYWWGITAQTKLVLDKCYCKGLFFKGKKIGLIVVGEASLENEQYQLIGNQFKCIGEYLSWDRLFYKSYSANVADDLSKDEKALAELKELGENL